MTYWVQLNMKELEALEVQRRQVMWAVGSDCWSCGYWNLGLINRHCRRADPP